MNQFNMNNMMSSPMNQFNMNNMMNTPTNQFNDNMKNNMFQMMNQMDINNNQGEEKMKTGDNNEKEPEYLTIIVKMEDGKDIHLQCKSNDKMEQVLNKFCIKAGCEKEDYEFIFGVNRINKEDSNSTVEDNGIQKKNDIIFAIKKNLSYIGEENNINLRFSMGNGPQVCISMNLNNTFKDAVNNFCRKVCLSEEDLKFLYQSKLLNADDRMTLGQIGIEDGSLISVIQMNNVIGA
jgi:hypothetical protein